MLRLTRFPTPFLSRFAALVAGAMAWCALWPSEGFSQSGSAPRRTKARSGATPQGSGAWGDPLGQGTSPDGSPDSELENYARETDPTLHSLSQGNVSIDVAFPGGSSAVLDGSAGARLLFSNRLAAGFAVLVGIDKETKKNAFGGALRFQSFLPTSTRAFPYVAVSLSGGKNGGEGNKDDDDVKAGAGLGVGAEVFLLKEISVSAEVGLTAQIMPGKAFRLATGTSQISAHLFLGH